MSNIADWSPDTDYETLKTNKPFDMISDQWTEEIKQAIDEDD